MRALLVTGATGCIGRATVALAIAQGWSVRGLARSQPPAWWPSVASYVRASVEDEGAMVRAASDCQAVVHLAAPVHGSNPSAEALLELERVIVAGTLTTARAARRAGAQFILASTVGVYGSPPPPFCDDRTPTNPRSPYARAKLAAEQHAIAEVADALVLRCAVAYGPGDRGNVTRLIRAIQSGHGFVVGDGSNRKSLVSSWNLAERILRCVEVRASGTWCVADAPALTQRQLMDLIADALGRRPPPALPALVVRGVARLLDVGRAGSGSGDRLSATVRSLISPTEVDGSGLDRSVGYVQKTSTDEGVRRYAAWIRLSQ